MGRFSKNVCSFSIKFDNFTEKSRNMFDLQSPLIESKMIQTIRYFVCVLIFMSISMCTEFYKIWTILPILSILEGGKFLPPPPLDLTYPRYPVTDRVKKK